MNTSRARRWTPSEMTHPPFLDPASSAGPTTARYALLINPFYRRLFSQASIWRRRPEDWRAVAPYLAMSYLYKRSNRFWHFLIQHHLVHAVWRPLVEATRVRHLSFRRGLAECETLSTPAVDLVSPGV